MDSLLERDKGPAPLKIVIPATTVNVEEVVQFGISLISEIGKSSEEGSSVASEMFEENEMFEESPEPMEKDELPSLLDLKLEWEHGEMCLQHQSNQKQRSPPYIFLRRKS
jgi:hypothetical protein